MQHAAERLHVHPNTLRCRVRPLREIASIDLEDPAQRLAAWLELRLGADAFGTPAAAAMPPAASAGSRA